MFYGPLKRHRGFVVLASEYSLIPMRIHCSSEPHQHATSDGSATFRAWPRGGAQCLMVAPNTGWLHSPPLARCKTHSMIVNRVGSITAHISGGIQSPGDGCLSEKTTGLSLQRVCLRLNVELCESRRSSFTHQCPSGCGNERVSIHR